MVCENDTGKVMGSSRYYELDKEKSSGAIGLTFIGRDYWSKGHNVALKKLILDHAFKFVDQDIFGATNFRSQRATEKLSAIKVGTIDIG